MLIVLEGTDLGGKTTFISFLSRFLDDIHVIHSVAPKRGEDPYTQYERKVDDALAKHKNVVCDRLHWSEPVYASVFNRKERLGIAGWRHIELFLTARHAQVVYFQPHEHMLKRRYEIRGDEHVTLEQVLEAYHTYTAYPAKSILPCITVVHGSVAIARHVWERGVILDRLPQITRVDPRYVGSLTPKALLFGERRNEERDRSAFVPRGATSGRFLLEALPDELWPYVGLTNACEPDGPDLKDVYERLGEPPVVALGHNAHDALVIANVPHSAVPHPQYVRRFLSKKQVAYGRLIAGVAGLNEDHLKWKGEDCAT